MINKAGNPILFNSLETHMSPNDSKLFTDHVDSLIEAHKRSLAREVAEADTPNIRKLNEKFWEEYGENAPAYIVTYFEALLQTKTLLTKVDQIRKNWQENKKS